VLASTGRRRLTELGGLAARLPLVAALYMIAALSIAGAPLFNGFVSKSVVVSAAAEGGWPVVELLLTVASVGTFLSTGLKLPYFTFFGPDRRIEAAPLPPNMLLGMLLTAMLCVGLGVAPAALYARLPLQPFEYHPYTVDHVAASLQLLAGTAAGFWLLRGMLGAVPATSLDVDWLYRRPVRRLFDVLVEASAAASEATRAMGAAVSARIARAASRSDTGARPDADAYRAPVGVIVLWVLAALVLLAAYGTLP
jgi:multicomponent Na+:H+ antiporter subunit D